MKKEYKYIAVYLIFSVLIGCEKFEDINTNPNDQTNVTASLLATNVILSVTEFSGRDAHAMISGQALPKYVGYATQQVITQYNKVEAASFDDYTDLPNIDKMIEHAEGSYNEDSYRGVGKFARANKFFYATMQMGDVPFSEANKGQDGLYKPKYDPQEQVLTGILDELKEADQFFASGNEFEGDPTPYDGDPVKWRQATNAFSLKVLMTLSEKEGNSTLNIKSRFAEIVAADNLMQSTSDYFGLEYTSVNKHPLYSTSNAFTKNTIISSLLIDNLKNLNDRRMYYLAEPSGSQVTNGIDPSDPDAYVGVDVSLDYTTMNANHSAGDYSLINLRYQEEEASEPRMLMTYAEQQLILSEACIRGWISGDAGTYYKEGVISALEAYLNYNADYAHGMPITQSYIDEYFTGEAAFKQTQEEQLQQIWMQRYILNFFQDNRSSYFEFRRNNYPEFPADPETSLNENNLTGHPMRWLYPEAEKTYNRENLIEALERQYDGADEINKLMWILK
jgi:hypothetical protein